VAEHVAGAEEIGERRVYWEGVFYQMITQGRFMPNSPTLMNAGRRLGMLSACFVLPVADDTAAIFQSITDTAQIQKAGGGTGFAFDELRPCGTFVKSSGGRSSGPISFWRVFSEATSAIQQGSFRRGANMAIMSVDHPDILKFLHVKEDLQQFVNYNISVKVTDKFMRLVREHPDAPLIVSWKDQRWCVPRALVDLCRKKVADGRSGRSHPRDLDICYGVQDMLPLEEVLGNELGTPDQQIACAKESDVVTVGEIMGLIVNNAWRTGEPGLFFVDRVRETEPTPEVALIQATNPCVVGDTEVLTLDGPRAIRDLAQAGKDVLVHAWDPDTKMPVIRTMRNIRKTRSDVDIVEVEFDSGLKVRCTPDHNFRTFRGRKIGAQNLRVGQSVRAYAVSRHRDGQQRAHAWVANRCHHQWVHRMALDCFGVDVPEGCIVHHEDGNTDNNYPANLSIITATKHNQIHYPERRASGFTTEGRVVSPETRQKIAAGLTRYFRRQRGQAAVNHKVIAIRPADKAAVYNGTVDDVHTYVIVDPEYRGDSDAGLWSGVVSSNCGEEPLMPNEACNLGSVNLGAFVDPFYDNHDVNPAELRPGHAGAVSRDDAEKLVDWDGLKECIHHAVRFLDNVVTINKYPTEAITETCHGNRKIGLGIMGFADALIRLGARYDSDEGLYWGSRLMKFVNEEAVRASQDLAEERGAFPWFHRNRRWKEPIRNACVTSVAPTGTISIIANCSGGIEPWFAFAFVRQVLDDGQGNKQLMHQYQPDLQKLAGRWGFDDLRLLERILASGSVQDCDEVPVLVRHIFRSAQDISPEWHVRMQAVFQEHVTSAVSKTINLPSSATVADVRTAYMLAHSSRVKGVTVYRDGCREHQPMALVGSEAKKAEPEVLVVPDTPAFRHPVKLPTLLPSVRTKYKSTYGSLHIHVSLVVTPDGRFRERELFFDLGRSGDGVHEIIEGFGRLSSMILRLDAPVDLIIEQLRGHASRREKANGHTGALTSLPNELAMGLMEYFEAVDAFRDEDGFLVSLPSFLTRTSGDKKTKVPGLMKPGEVTRSHAFINKVTRASAQLGTLRRPCPTMDCPGELVYSEGCNKCLVCGEGSC
jgi:ribonucleotide reductase alpha subunit